MAARWSAWWVWAALAGSLVFWGLRLAGPSRAPVPGVQTVATDQAVRGDVARMLGVVAAAPGAAPVAPPASTRFKLIGAVAAAGGAGWAVLSVDERPLRTVRVGAVVDGDWVLQSVTARQVLIGPVGGPAQVVLDLPQLPPPATGTLAAAATLPPPGQPMPPGAGQGFSPGIPAAGSPAAMPQPVPVPAVVSPDGTVSAQPPSLQAPPGQEQVGTVTGGPVDPNQVR